jgi:hypothetical protein
MVLTCAFACTPSNAKDDAADVQKNEAKAAAETNKANADVAKGHSFRAGRAAKKAAKAQEKAAAEAQGK